MSSVSLWTGCGSYWERYAVVHQGSKWSTAFYLMPAMLRWVQADAVLLSGFGAA